MTPRKPKPAKHVNGKDILLGIGMVLLAVAFIFPFVWLIMTSFKPPAEVFSGSFFPSRWTTENYEQVFKQVPMWRWMGNTALVAVLGVVSVVLPVRWSRLASPGFASRAGTCSLRW